jgi:lysozyme family protein
MPNVEALKANNTIRWANAKLTRGPEFDKVAERLVGARARYKAVEARTGVPWFIIAVIHQRESSGSFSGVLHNGERIIGTGRKTSLVPKGRGPFSSWEEAAADALVNCHPYAARNKDWSAGGALTLLEQYNGLGYFNKGIPSPYIWAGTNQYKKGKYVADGRFDPEHVDQQLGCAGLLMAMKEFDPSVDLGSPRPVPPPDIPPPEPVNQPAGFLAVLLSILTRLFKRN